MINQLELLKKYTTVVADTGDFESIKQYTPQDATTNPSLILKASKQDKYLPIIQKCIKDAPSSLSGEALISSIMNNVLVSFGKEILNIIPGRVSTEVDARLSFDSSKTIDKAKEIIELYKSLGIDKDRILIKIASTWEGIEAATELEKEGIHCNLTLMFSLIQAIPCATGNIKLISPFVGRIYDWFKKLTSIDYQGVDDPGVKSVEKIYEYYKKFNYETEIMGASFRNVGQIISLAGCDLLTIGPDLLDQLQNSTTKFEERLNSQMVSYSDVKKININEKSFRFLLNEDAMATEKTAEGIRKFSADIREMESLIQSMM